MQPHNSGFNPITVASVAVLITILTRHLQSITYRSGNDFVMCSEAMVYGMDRCSMFNVAGQDAVFMLPAFELYVPACLLPWQALCSQHTYSVARRCTKRRSLIQCTNQCLLPGARDSSVLQMT